MIIKPENYELWNDLMDLIFTEMSKRMTKQMINLGMINDPERKQKGYLEERLEDLRDSLMAEWDAHRVATELIAWTKEIAAIFDEEIEKEKGMICRDSAQVLRNVKRRICGEGKE